jgi:flagellar motor switch protein FliM
MNQQQILSQDEVDALLEGITGEGQPSAAEPAPADGARGVDFATHERIVRPRLPALEVVGERFARNARSGLIDLFRRSPEVSVGGIKVQRYSAFLREIVVPTSFNILSVRPLRGSGLIVLEPNLVFAAIDALFGGAGRFHARIEGRDFSATEQRVIRRLIDTLAAEYKKAWSSIYPLELDYQRSEMQPQFVDIATPGEMVVSSSFTFEFGDASGTMHLCIPYATLEPIRDVLAASVQADAAQPDRRWLDVLKQEIQSATVTLVTELASADTTVEQLLALKAGDFIELDLNPVVQAKVDGVPVFACHYGTSGGKYAIKIERPLTGPSRGWLGEQHVS